MPYRKGQSGNPKGRPPRSLALSEILREKADEHLLPGFPNKHALAAKCWQFAITGEVELAGETYKAETVSEWMTAVQWIYNRIDGPTQTDRPGSDITIHVIREGDDD